MRSDTHDASAIGAFVGISTVLSLALGVLAWVVRLPSGYYLMRNGMLLVPALSVILAAQGFAVSRRLGYAGGALAGFVLVEFIAAAAGVQAATASAAGFGTSIGITLVTLGYHTFLLLYPLVVLVFFVGNRPRRLWTRRVSGGSAKKQRH